MNPDEPNSHAHALTSAAADGTVPAPHDFSDPKLRQRLRDELRAEEWAMHQELMAAARVALRNLYENRQKCTVADVARILDLSSKLGRLATESEGALTANETDTTIIMLEFKAALAKVYARRKVEGRPAPAGAVVDVEPVTPKA